jgi:hypothetical protein
MGMTTITLMGTTIATITATATIMGIATAMIRASRMLVAKNDRA